MSLCFREDVARSRGLSKCWYYQLLLFFSTVYTVISFPFYHIAIVVNCQLPVVFTGILAALRTAFNPDNVAADYGTSYINDDQAVSPDTINPTSWAPNVLCSCIPSIIDPNCNGETGTAFLPAYLIAISPPYGTNEFIDSVIDKLNASWTTDGNQPDLSSACAEYVPSLPFAEGMFRLNLFFVFVDHVRDPFLLFIFSPTRRLDPAIF